MPFMSSQFFIESPKPILAREIRLIYELSKNRGLLVKIIRSEIFDKLTGDFTTTNYIYRALHESHPV